MAGVFVRWLLANVSTLAVAWAQLLSPTLLGAVQDVMQSHLCSALSLLVAAPQSQPGGTGMFGELTAHGLRQVIPLLCLYFSRH